MAVGEWQIRLGLFPQICRPLRVRLSGRPYIREAETAHRYGGKIKSILDCAKRPETSIQYEPAGVLLQEGRIE